MSLLDPDKITLWSPAYIQRYGSDSSKVFTFKKSKGALKFVIIVFFLKNLHFTSKTNRQNENLEFSFV